MRRLLLLLLSSLLAAVLPGRAVEQPTAYRLVLSGESVSETLQRTRSEQRLATEEAIGQSGRDRKIQVLAEQAAVESELGKQGLKVITRTTILLNSVTVHALPSKVDQLRKIPGVKGVYKVTHYKRSLTTSVPFIHAPEVWTPPGAGSGYTGKGVRIAIIDSGIDYTHADFGGSGSVDDYNNNDPTVIEPGSFPTAKVVGGTDLAGDDYDASTPGQDTPVPDPDPLDPGVPSGASGHGSHVAGIAAGMGVLSTGATFAGAYGPAIYSNNFKIGPGVAPEASLYAVKIFGAQGSTDLVPEGLDWAADPNGDGSTADHADVANLSLGSPLGEQDTTDPEQISIKQLAGLGCVVAIAAGNEGNTHYIIGAPGITPECIAVANIFDDGVAFSTTQITAPAAVAGEYVSVEGAFTPPLSQVGPITAALVYVDPNNACSAINNAAALKGNIALIDRGTCFFSDKVRAVQGAGAVGAIVVNNQPGVPIVMAGSGDTSDIKIPAVMISQSDGELLKAQLANGLTAKLANTAASIHPELADIINESSSRGPALNGTKLKPDIAAPGTSIASVQAGAGSDSITYSGTSMATPHIAGAAALLKQEHPAWTAYDIKAALMNTAVPSHTTGGQLYPEVRTGAGRVDVNAAASTTVLARNANPQAEVALSFGAYELAASMTVTRTIRIDNRGANPVTLNVAISNTLAQPGIVFTAGTNTVTIAANGTATVNIQVAIDPTKLDSQPDPTSGTTIGGWPIFHMDEATGQVYLTGGGSSAHVPFHVAARATSAYNVAAMTVGAPTNSPALLPFPTAGTSAHPKPLVSVFDFGASSPNQSLGFPDADGDLLDVGAATDLAKAASFDEAHVFFAIAVAGKWLTPQRGLEDLDIEIDLNGDGTPDYTIANSSQGNFNATALEDPTTSNDALLSVAFQGASGDIPATMTTGSVWNLLDPSFRDTAPYQNAVVIHGMLASDIGLSSTQTKFRYRGSTIYGLQGDTDTTAWATYDIAKPIVDATGYGLQTTPLFDEGHTAKAAINRANAASGATSVKALVLHQHNQPGSQAEVVTVRLDTNDADGNGLPDAWELTYFFTLGNSPDADPDHDGYTNAQELAAGTDPTDPNSKPVSNFKIISVTQGANGNTVTWTGAAGTTYNLERTTSLTEPFYAVVTRITGVDGTNSAVDTNPPQASAIVFYRIKIP